MKIINIGIYPPPIGGISIYLQRLKEYLDIKGMDNVIINILKYKSMEKSNRGVKNISWRKAVIFLFEIRKPRPLGNRSEIWLDAIFLINRES